MVYLSALLIFMSNFKDNQLMAGEIALGIIIVAVVLLILGAVATLVLSNIEMP